MWLRYNKNSKNYVLNIKNDYDLLDTIVKDSNSKFDFDKYYDDLVSDKINLETIWTDMIKYNMGFTYSVERFERLSEGIHTMTSDDILACKLIKNGFMRKGNIRE
ncbi:MAG: hypothetical protein ABF991_00510 [Liquorilactobacillus hordei]|uniref:hypothetical protein n=1 Tax=Liquorilactobacillus hordei TaxID=468911 RepID=UPI0039E7EEDB